MSGSTSAPDFDRLLGDRLLKYFGGDAPANLREAISYSLLAPGKRIRPRLTLAASEALGLSSSATLPVALAIEMIHCFSLIHDDLPCMDNDDFRRGLPSNHKKFGESLALLAGDALVPLAYEVFLEISDAVAGDRMLAALKRFNWAIGPRGLIGGQAAEALLTENSKLEQVTGMFAGKTGALFTAAILIPKDLAGIPDNSAGGAAIDHFARELGFAFQVADDLEDKLEGKPAPTHILHYLSREVAISTTKQKLSAASDGLRANWGDRAHALLIIAEEVQSKLRHT